MAKHSILILTNRVPYPLNDGGSLAMYSMIEGYYNAGWEVFVFSMNTSRHYVASTAFPALFQQIKFETFDINTDVRFVPMMKNFLLSRKPNHAERFFSKEYEQKLKQLILAYEPEVIQIESIYLATYLSSVKSVSNAVVALRLHNIEYQIWERLSHETTVGFKKIYLRDLAARIRRFETQAWQQADVLIAITEADAKIVRTAAPNTRCFVAPYGINSLRLPPAHEGEQWHAYHIGAMDWVPNAEAITWFMEEIWPDVHKAVPDFEFHFAGRNMPYVFQKYEGDGIYCMGEVADAQTFIADKKMLLVPLHSGGGIRIKVLEAMAAGKLVIATSIAMQGIDNLTPGVHYLLANTAEEFKAQIIHALAHKEESAKIAREGATAVRAFYDEAEIMKNLIAGIRSLLK